MTAPSRRIPVAGRTTQQLWDNWRRWAGQQVALLSSLTSWTMLASAASALAQGKPHAGCQLLLLLWPTPPPLPLLLLLLLLLLSVEVTGAAWVPVAAASPSAAAADVASCRAVMSPSIAVTRGCRAASRTGDSSLNRCKAGSHASELPLELLLPNCTA
jgi:hypothetical protein